MEDLNIDNMPIATLRVDGNYIIIYTNQECLKLFGYSKLVGEKLEILVPENHREKHFIESQRYYANPDKKPLGLGRDLPGLKKDGSIVFLEIGLYPLSDGTVLVLLVDIAFREAKAIDSNLENLQYKLKHLLDSVDKP